MIFIGGGFYHLPLYGVEGTPPETGGDYSGLSPMGAVGGY